MIKRFISSESQLSLGEVDAARFYVLGLRNAQTQRLYSELWAERILDESTHVSMRLAVEIELLRRVHAGTVQPCRELINGPAIDRRRLRHAV